MTVPELLAALALPLAFVAGALWVARRERASYEAHKDDVERLATPFVYTARRLRRRRFGAGVLAAVGVTLGVWELARPETPDGAAAIVAALVLEVILLVGVAVADLLETGRTRRLPR